MLVIGNSWVIILCGYSKFVDNQIYGYSEIRGYSTCWYCEIYGFSKVIWIINIMKFLNLCRLKIYWYSNIFA